MKAIITYLKKYKSIFLLLGALLITLVVMAPAISVYGVSTTLDAAYCTTPLNGTWDSTFSRCTIPGGISGAVPVGDVIRVLTGQHIIVDGTLTVTGTLELGGGTLVNNGTLTNNGSINHMTSGAGGIRNFGTLTNNGSLTIYSGAELMNYGAFINAASLNVYGELINNFTGSYYGSFTNNASSELQFFGSGAFFAATSTTNTNHGTITIKNTSARMNLVGPLTNHGTINNFGGTFLAVDLTNTSTGIILNTDLNANWTCGNSDRSKLVNEGSFTNRYILNINQKCVFTNKSGGSLLNEGNTYIGETDGTGPVGTLLNQGSLTNRGKIILMGWSADLGVRLHNDNGGVIINAGGSAIELGLNTKMFNTGLIEHKGVIQPGTSGSGQLVNYLWNDPWDGDPGVINKYCAGSITIPTTDYHGNPVIDLCTGTIIIRKDTVPDGPTDFSFSGDLGTFLLDDDADGTLTSERTFSGLAPGSYSVTEAAATGFALTNLVCTSTEGYWDTTTVDVGTRTATIDLDGDINETVTCTFTNTVDSCTPPAVTTQPVTQEITYGQDASFTVAGTNYTSVQWQVHSGSGWTNITGATSLTYNLTKPAVSLNGSQYRAVLTGGCEPTAISNAATLTVNKAAVTATAGSYSGTYDGDSHSPSACAVTGTYTGDLSCTNNPVSVGPDVGSGAISPAVNGTGLTNYAITSVNGSWSITKADPTCAISGYTGVYDGDPHGASGSCTGLKGETLTGLDLGDSFTNVPGGHAVWSFKNNNYEAQNGSVDIVITKADPFCAISGYTGVYDGDPHGASGSCTGVKGETLTTLKLGGTFTDVPGGTADWTFVDTSGNYNDDSGSVKIVIEKATLTVTADDQTAQYSDASPELTFNYSGFIGSEGPDDLTTKPSCSTTRQIMSPAGDYPITCSGGEDDNYTFSYVEGKFTVTKESAGITYTGDTQVTTAKAGAKARVTFAATLEEQQDGMLGNHLTGQKILFEVFSFGDTSLTKPVASCTATIDHVVNGKGYGSCTIDLSAADPYQVKISLVINGYYKAVVELVVVLVNDPGTGMANGGGWLIDPNTDSRVSFGFTAKFLKNGRVQGNSLFIYRVTTDLSTIVPGAPVGEREYNWIIKSNAMQGLYIYDCTVKTTSGCKATITGKNTVQAVDRETGVLYSIGGNYQFQVDVIDNQEPGSSGTGPDQYAIRVWDSSGTYYELGNSYDDHGMLISPLEIAAGNIQVKAKK